MKFSAILSLLVWPSLRNVFQSQPIPLDFEFSDKPEEGYENEHGYAATSN